MQGRMYRGSLGIGGAVLCGIRQLNILMVGSTFKALRGFVLGFWMETIGVAIRTTADPNLDATPFGVGGIFEPYTSIYQDLLRM